MILFPIGTVAASSRVGTISGIATYPMFEPNNGCKSTPYYSNEVTRFQNQTSSVKQTGLPYISITYRYDNIFHSEYDQIKKFIYSIEDNITSCYVVDFSKGEIPSDIDASYTVTTENTMYYSDVTYYKANYMFFSNGYNWKLGEVSGVSEVVGSKYITVNVTDDYGDMTGTIASTNVVYIYPVYECYTVSGALNSFQKTEYVGKGDDIGFMRNGEINFVSRYKI